MFLCQAWVGHPYVDVIDNSTDFNKKVRRAIDVRTHFFKSIIFISFLSNLLRDIFCTAHNGTLPTANHFK